MNVLKTTKMNSKILVVVLLAYFLNNLSAATLKPVKSTSLNGKNTPAQFKNTLVFKQPIKSHPPVFGNFKANPTVPYNIPATQSPATPPASPTPTKPPTPPSSHTFLPSIKKPLPPSRASAPTTVPTNENNNHQGFNPVGKGDDYYYEEEEEEEDEDEEEEGEEEDEGEEDEEPLGNSNTVKIPTQSKPTISTKVNNNSNKFQTSQLKPSSSTSKPTVPERVNQGNDNHQEFETLEDDDEEEEVEEEEEGEDEEPLESSNSVKIPTESKPTISAKVNNNSNKFQTSQLKPSSSTSKPTVPERVNQGNDNHQEFETLEDDDEEEEVEEEEEGEDEEPLESSNSVKIPTESKPTISAKVNNNSNKFQTSQPKPSSSPPKPTVTKIVNQENDNHQEFETLEGDDYEEVSDENEDGHNVEEYSEDLDHNTPKDNIKINGDLVNLPVPMNNPFSTLPQYSDDESTENNYNEFEYSLNTDEDHQLFKNYDEWEPKSSNINNNDNTKDQLINTNKFESNPYDTQIFTDKQEENAEYQINNQYGSENKERIINGYEAIKKILYMLHDYASSTFNWIINKINYRMDQVSRQNII